MSRKNKNIGGTKVEYNKNSEYYLGLDMGVTSVGWAVTDNV